MGPRRIILLVCVFIALVGGLWAYLSATQEATPPQWIRSMTGVLKEASQPLSAGADTRHAATPPTKLRPSRRREPSPLPSLPQVLDRADETAAALRGDMQHSVPTMILAARKALADQDFENALRQFERALKVSSKNSAALEGRAGTLVLMKRLDEAEAAYRRWTEACPDQASAHYNFGVYLYRRSRYGEASEQFRLALGIEPRHDRALYNLATLAQRDGRLTEARDCWEDFVLEEPRVAGAWFNLGLLYWDMEEPLAAGRCFAVYTTMRDDDPDGFINLGACFSALSDFPNAQWAQAKAELLAGCDQGSQEQVAALALSISEAMEH